MFAAVSARKSRPPSSQTKPRIDARDLAAIAARYPREGHYDPWLRRVFLPPGAARWDVAVVSHADLRAFQSAQPVARINDFVVATAAAVKPSSRFRRDSICQIANPALLRRREIRADREVLPGRFSSRRPRSLAKSASACSEGRRLKHGRGVAGYNQSMGHAPSRRHSLCAF